jgi:hypothetical protein
MDARTHKCPGPSQPLPPAGQITREEMISRITAWQAEHGHKRRYGTGSVFLAKNGTWYGFLTVGRDEGGNRIRKKLTGHNREEVEAKLDAGGRLAQSNVTPLRFVLDRDTLVRGSTAERSGN